LSKNQRREITSPLRRLRADGSVNQTDKTDFQSEAGGLAFDLIGATKMAKKIDESQVRQVAKLSRLDLSDVEVTAFSVQLNAILDYMKKLDELDTTGVEPLAHCLPVKNVFREDKVGQSLGVEKTLANAPQRDGEFFKVPKILDDGSSA